MRELLIGLAAAMLLGAGCKDSGNLASSDPKEVAKAIQATASTGDERAVERIAPLASHTDTQMASEAVIALGRMSSPKAVAVLQQVAATDHRPEVRRVAVVSLAQQPQRPQAVETLRETLTRDQAPEVRTAAAMGLARSGTLDDVSVLAAAATFSGNAERGGVSYGVGVCWQLPNGMPLFFAAASSIAVFWIRWR